MNHFIRISAWTVILATVSMAYGQAASEPFTGIITGDDVYVRAGASQNYYAVTKLNKGDFVEVHDNLFGWYRIAPPAGSYSYISKAYVTPNADGSEGEVTGDKVRVRAPSPAGPDASYRIQVKLDKGAKVKILGAEASYYKIVPPEQVYLFVSEKFVAKPTAAQLAARRLATEASETEPTTPDTTTATATDTTATPDTSTTATTTAAVPDTATATTTTMPDTTTATTPDTTAPDTATATTPDTTAAVPDTTPTTTPDTPTTTPDTTTPTATEAVEPPSDLTFEALEQQFAAEAAKPAAEQQVDGLLAGYQKLLADKKLEPRQKAVADARVQTLSLVKQLQDAEAKLAAANATTPATTAGGATTTALPVTYDAVGLLRTSTLYTGQKLPLMYRLVDPSTQPARTIAYVLVDRQNPPAQLLGRVVGVVGSKQYDAGLRLNVITARQIDSLSAAQ
jgi:uncharacterized protein YgiM (DUF1202 family)